MAELLPRFSASLERIADQRKIGRALLEAEATDVPTRTAAGGTAAGDPRRLRGLPAIGRNVSGAMRGTDPLGELIRKESQRRR